MLKIFFRSQCIQSLLRRTFQVHRNTVRQLHQVVELVIFYGRHYFEVKVPIIPISPANNFSRLDDLILCRHAAFDNTRRQEHALYLASTLECIKATSQLIWRERETLHHTAPGTKGTVEAVFFAGCRRHSLEDRKFPLWGRYMRDTFGKAT